MIRMVLCEYGVAMTKDYEMLDYENKPEISSFC